MCTLSRLIMDKRKELDLTQGEIARELGVSRQTISKWENGHIQHMSVGLVAKYAAILKLPAIAFIYPDSYLESKYIGEDYINIAKRLEDNNISIKNIEAFINLVSDMRLELFKDIR